MDNEMNFYMYEALVEAQKAFDADEVPIGCVIVRDFFDARDATTARDFSNPHGASTACDAIIARAFNKRNALKNALAHAEITAIHQACQQIGDWRLEDCTLYVTIEPCPMCAGAIIQARIPRVVFGAKNAKAGCAGSILNLLSEPRFNHQPTVIPGVLEEECGALMSKFFLRFR